MNVFEHRIFINEKPCSVHVDTSKEPGVKVVINNVEAVSDNVPVRLFGTNSIWYYVIYVGEVKLTVEINTAEPHHKYNLYVNDVSQIDGSSFYDELEKAKTEISLGFKNFVKTNWKRIMKENGPLTLVLPSVFIISGFVLKKILALLIVAIVLAPLYMPVFIFTEWVGMKNLIKNHHKRFRSETHIRI